MSNRAKPLGDRLAVLNFLEARRERKNRERSEHNSCQIGNYWTLMITRLIDKLDLSPLRIIPNGDRLLELINFSG